MTNFFTCHCVPHHIRIFQGVFEVEMFHVDRCKIMNLFFILRNVQESTIHGQESFLVFLFFFLLNQVFSNVVRFDQMTWENLWKMNVCVCVSSSIRSICDFKCSGIFSSQEKTVDSSAAVLYLQAVICFMNSAHSWPSNIQMLRSHTHTHDIFFSNTLLHAFSNVHFMHSCRFTMTMFWRKKCWMATKLEKPLGPVRLKQQISHSALNQTWATRTCDTNHHEGDSIK